MTKFRAYILPIERKGKKGNRTTLHQRLYLNGEQWQTALGISVDSRDYNKDKCEVTGKDADYYNWVIRESQHILSDIITRCELVEHKTPVLKEVTEEYVAVMRAKGLLRSQKSAESVTDYNRIENRMDDFIADQSALKGWTSGTSKRFEIIKEHIVKYEGKLLFDSLTDSDLLAFLQHLSKDNGMMNTTLQRIAGQLRWYLRWAMTKGYYNGKCHETFRPKFQGGHFEEKNIIYLTVDELRTIEEHAFSVGQAHLERIRDAFLFSCYSGLRFSDIQRLTPNNIDSVSINIVTKKDHKRISVDLNKHTRAIVEKYKDWGAASGRALPVPSNQKANKYLHEVMEVCGIDTLTSQVYVKGDKREEVWLPKYELVTFHTGRKTFITQALRLGIPVPVIMKFTGHTSMHTLKAYMKVVDELKQKEMTKFDTI